MQRTSLTQKRNHPADVPQGDSYQDKWESQPHSREETSGQSVLFLTLFAVFNIGMSAQHSSKIVDQIHFQTKQITKNISSKIQIK